MIDAGKNLCHILRREKFMEITLIKYNANFLFNGV